MSPTKGQITHALLTRAPLSSPRKVILVRLACVRHAASVRSEPGSNSPVCSLNSYSINEFVRLNQLVIRVVGSHNHVCCAYMFKLIFKDLIAYLTSNLIFNSLLSLSKRVLEATSLGRLVCVFVDEDLENIIALH